MEDLETIIRNTGNKFSPSSRQKKTVTSLKVFLLHVLLNWLNRQHAHTQFTELQAEHALCTTKKKSGTKTQWSTSALKRNSNQP